MRKLQASEVEFELTIEPEEMEVGGNASARGEPEDSEYWNEIIERLDRGDVEAWCCVFVKATWRGYAGRDTLGGCSFAAGSGDEVRRQVEEMAHDVACNFEAFAGRSETMSREDDRAKLLARREREGFIPEAGFDHYPGSGLPPSLRGVVRSARAAALKADWLAGRVSFPSVQPSKATLRGQMVHIRAERWWER